MSKPKVFLSYRREDSESATRNIRTALLDAGHTHVFMDIPEIDAGEKWRARLSRDLREADVVIAVIGDRWLNCHHQDGRRRIDTDDDFVRWELITALKDTQKRIVPVLVGKTGMPSPSDLPKALRKLASFQAKRLTSANWDDDVKSLILALSENGSRPRANLVLASTSPRRRQLLQTIGWTEGQDYFAVQASVPPDGNQAIHTLEAAERLAVRTARAKISWLRGNVFVLDEKLPHGWSPAQTVLVGVDTIVYCQGKVLDRPLLKGLEFAGPQDLAMARERAREMLEEERGGTVHVITGLAMATMGTNETPVTTVTVTEATLRGYSDTDITRYIASSEPLDKAGAFGIQEKGVSLFERISGSYTNVVGLPVREFVKLLEGEYGGRFILPDLRSSAVRGAAAPATDGTREPLSVVCVGDINYDFVYDGLPPGFLPALTAPGKKVKGAIHRAVGGTAVNFAKGAKEAGFESCSVVGVVGGDAIGQEILKELAELDIDTIIYRDPSSKSGIAVILRDKAKRDTLTLTDARQALPTATVNKALTPIEKSDVVYCSGHCLADRYRYDSALDILRAAKKADCLVVLTLVADMFQDMSRGRLDGPLRQQETRPLVDVAITEIPEVLDWFRIDADCTDELAAWHRHRADLVGPLRERFPVTILRTRGYTHEIVITQDRVDGPLPLDYEGLDPERKTGYGDARTAHQVHSFLSPRIVLASKSPQRHALLRQIVAPSKVQVIASQWPEEIKEMESPDDRVRRVAGEKAQWVLDHGNFHDDVELIIGADTEIVRQSPDGQWKLIGHPTTREQAFTDLKQLNSGSHYALTGLAVIGEDPAEPGRLKTVVVSEKTKVTFVDADDEQLRAYADTGEPLGRAGAYAVQGLGTLLIESVDGSYSNVVGLPLERLSQVLADEFGKPVWHFDKVSNWCFPAPIKELRR